VWEQTLEASAPIIYSFTESCRSAGVNPLDYFRDVIPRPSYHPRDRLAGHGLRTHSGWLSALSNTMFFAGMVAMLIVHGGWSVRQYVHGPLRGVNRYCRRIFMGYFPFFAKVW
jgi:hypothetical protein